MVNLGNAPITLFTYNRPWHTRETVEALLENAEAEDSDLVIFSDGPKDDIFSEKVAEVREYLRTISGFKSIRIIEQKDNLGLAQSIISGVSEIVNEYGRVIVLEDDIVTSPFFLKYMNDALNYYHDEDKIMHISGWNYPIETQGLPETFFMRGTSCWGWATWSRAWKHFEKDPQKLIQTFIKEDIHSFDYNGAAEMWKQVVANFEGKMNTWAVFWYASVFKRGGLCLHPTRTLVRNIGLDGSGAHCGDSDIFQNHISTSPVTDFLDDIVENPTAMERITEFLISQKKSFFRRTINKLQSFLGRT